MNLSAEENIFFQAIKSRKAITIYQTIQKFQEEGDNLIYYNKLKRETGISQPTINKYLDIFNRLGMVEIDSGEGEVSEYYISKKTNTEISRKKRIWVRTINLNENENSKKYEKIVSELFTK